MPISLKMNSSSIDCVHKSFYTLWSPELTESLDSSDSSQDSESSTYDTIFGIKKIIDETLNRNILRKSKFQINGFNSNLLINGKYLKICFSRIKDLFLSRALWPFNPPLFSDETNCIKLWCPKPEPNMPKSLFELFRCTNWILTLSQLR